MIGKLRKFIRIVLFLVYVGGIMILVRYCVMMVPTPKFSAPGIGILFRAGLLSMFLGWEEFDSGTFYFGLIYRARAVLLIAILLYLVILAIVEIVNYSKGIIKLYVKHCKVFHCLHFNYDNPYNNQYFNIQIGPG